MGAARVGGDRAELAGFGRRDIYYSIASWHQLF